MNFEPNDSHRYDTESTTTDGQISEAKQPPPASEPDRFETAAREVILATGENLNREGLLATPQRYSRAMHFLLGGYKVSAKEAIGNGVFAAEGQGVVSVNNVEFFSQCEHHMLPFWGKASVAYYPNQKILGLSKIPRIVDVFARRLQVQERLTRDIKEAICELIEPRAVVVRLKACHMCMMMRGVQKQSSHTYTEETHGVNALDPTERDRIFAAIANGDKD